MNIKKLLPNPSNNYYLNFAKAIKKVYYFLMRKNNE